MILKNSRYFKARAYQDTGALAPFAGVRPREIGPAAGVIEHTIGPGDRFELLAQRYYNDTRMWWRILDANPNVLYAADLFKPENQGAVILVPRAVEPSGGL